MWPYVGSIVLAAVVGIVKYIAYIAGIYFVGTVVRDVASGQSTPVELSRDETIEKILDDPALTPEQRAILVEAYIEKMSGDSEFGAVVNKLMIVAVVIAVAYLAATYMKK